ncbi:MAG TPA: hypothetical protein VMY87_10275 [Armatimonadota bacterium]|nr:hypothetical protein [Armatimonadota bacterium]
MDRALSMDGQRRGLGLTFRQVAGLTGLAPGTVHRAITDPSRANNGDARRIRQTLSDEERIRRSSDPALLRHVIGRAVPFLRGRARG